ncbi:GNAT family N-acetyltransferase [Streptomyces sp. WAC07061]|uniref:GNAT family N-acetyltransferase n=1 Tax=Streptomyces sp. WAC07061 TaxID=2487410 RepID=UPI000F7AC1D2|nr:GNAT family N-acetyltransferase [Streptomyces sp. WAC07061]RSS34063.1 GNAT family N-acetyltransferase [Streptomyces sp. WAC07061]
MTTRLRRLTDLRQARGPLVEAYADVRAPLLHLPNYSLRALAERLERYGQAPGFAAVLAFDAGDRPVGYAYGNTVEAGDLWWKRISDDLDTEYTRAPTLALREIGVTVPFRGTGLARRIHDELLAGREDRYASLMVNPAAGQGKVQQVYASWGYEAIGPVQPAPDSPVLTAMVRPLNAYPAHDRPGTSGGL